MSIVLKWEGLCYQTIFNSETNSVGEYPGFPSQNYTIILQYLIQP